MIAFELYFAAPDVNDQAMTGARLTQLTIARSTSRLAGARYYYWLARAGPAQRELFAT